MENEHFLHVMICVQSILINERLFLNSDICVFML